MNDQQDLVTRGRYFISANSMDGFYSLYDTIFSNQKMDKIYVIHGGPGTGKSTVMRRAASSAAAKGAIYDEIRCSSDPDSLDGVILSANGKTVGILDGTPPHPRIIKEPAYREELWNIGTFWQGDLIDQKAAMAENKEKKKAYAYAYSLLSAAGKCHLAVYDALLADFDTEKARGKQRRQMRYLTQRGEGKEKWIRAISMKGTVTLTEEFAKAEKIYLLQGKKYSAEIYLSIYEEELKKEGMEYVALRSPLTPKLSDGIYFPMSKTLLLHEGIFQGEHAVRRIHMSRFLSENKEKTVHPEKAEALLMKETCHALKKAAVHHFALEDMYRAVMDFHRLEKQTEEWIDALFAVLKLK